MRVTKNKLKDESVVPLSHSPHNRPNLLQPHRYGALSNTMQSTNGATSPIKSPSKKPTGTPKKATTAATPGPKKRARKAADVEADVDADGTDDDSEPSPAGKKAKAATPAAKGAKVVKTEPDQENGLAGDEDVNFF